MRSRIEAGRALVVVSFLIAACGTGSGADDDAGADDDSAVVDDDATGDDDGAPDDDSAPPPDDDSAPPPDDDGTEPPALDADGDGHDGVEHGGDDCDDGDPAVHPGAPEDCDGVDDDCDGVVDGGDGDGDGFAVCEDCDDADPEANPGASEDCDGVDDDCDGLVDGADPDLGEDADGDGHGVCEDCDDADPAVHDDAEEICNGVDDDCDGVVDGDQDGDGSPACEDCAPLDPAVGVGVPEVCDGRDNDCDTLVDLDDPDLDLDGDGDGEAAEACGGSDCDDGDAGVHPGAPEVCDLRDDDCDGSLGDCSLADAAAVLIGESSDDHAASAVCSGDVNGDGLSDLIVGAPDHEAGGTGAGAVYVVYGPVAGELDLSWADAKLVGETSNDRVGNSCSADGDVNGDGQADLLVGSWGLDGDAPDGGGAYLMLGPVSGTVDLSLADARLLGEAEDDHAGFDADIVGDVNGDGYDDLLIGAYGRDSAGTDAGAAYLVLGPVTGTVGLGSADAVLEGVMQSDLAGYTVSGAGDVNGDGYDDLLVGAHHADCPGSSSGCVYVVYGPVSGTVSLATADARLGGEAAADNAGLAVAPAGDVDGDGFDDVLVGAPGYSFAGDGRGAAYLLRGPLSGELSLADAHARLVGSAAGAAAGTSVASVGDVDGDGFADLLIGAPGDNGSGAAYLVPGPVEGTLPLREAGLRLLAISANDRAGASVASAGDVDGDGLPDLLVGADSAEGLSTLEGEAYLVLGSSL